MSKCNGNNTESKEEYMKKWVILTEFGNLLEQYIAMAFTEWITNNKNIYFYEALILIESMKIMDDDLIFHLKDNTKIIMKLENSN